MAWDGDRSSGAGEALDTCGCCREVPLGRPVANRPGLPALRYRVGTHPTFLGRMLRSLPSEPVLDGTGTVQYPLEGLTTRSTDDLSIALLDAWATVADVLTFYQERIANEGFLRTATERRSVLDLARAIGYELNPGVAASTYLAFTVDDSPGAPPTVDVTVGTRVQSVPVPGSLPQTFETVESIEARSAWNAIRPQLTETWRPRTGDTSMYVKGVDTQLQPGDAILIVGQERIDNPGSGRWDLRILQTVTPDLQNNRTLLDWAEPPGLVVAPDERTRGPLGGKATAPAQQDPRVYALRLRANLFGYNAPEWKTLPDETRQRLDPTDPNREQWPGFEIQQHPPVVFLDAAYPKVLPGGWLALARTGWTELYRAELVSLRARTDFNLSARVTRVRLDTAEHLNFFGLRNTGVHAQSEELTPADTPLTDAVDGDGIVLDGIVDGLVAGQTIALTVQRPPGQETAPPVGEVAVIESVGLDDEGTRTLLRLATPLQNSYERSTLLINANVALATHGESVREVLGSGDGTKSNQSFTLKRPPLTYVPASTPSGASSTLTVRTDGVAWTEAPSLYGRTSRDQVYIVRIADDGTAVVTFGDGTTGTRLPSGQDNVVASYRTGIGPDGEVGAGALTLLQSRPLGLRAVENPVPATGATAPERLADARRNAPLTVLTLERMVSVLDYEDFARSFAGIEKAQATAVWSGASHVVHVTVAGTGGATVDPSSRLSRNLLEAIDAARDPVREVQVDSFRPLAFRIRARVLIDARRDQEDVLAAVDAAVRARFAFEEREFGQPVFAAEIIVAIQAVSGVLAVNLEELHLVDDAGTPVPPLLAAALAARRASAEGGEILPAELLLLADDGVALEVMTP